jgi:alanine-alpha-ketoisovalerate/valine-pyruvate aminotransferase
MKKVNMMIIFAPFDVPFPNLPWVKNIFNKNCQSVSAATMTRMGLTGSPVGIEAGWPQS